MLFALTSVNNIVNDAHLSGDAAQVEGYIRNLYNYVLASLKEIVGVRFAPAYDTTSGVRQRSRIEQF